ncbi:MAG TPA: glycoside hydrolase family 3 N-terminal domain-containing protein, partial [Acidimicrobiales bacterium]|nr:glycoside hydrolase family 3 N-terminal domain-containing protein [Acidimicrobiales bacterium]
MTDPAGLLGEMTLEEKAAQLGAVWSSRLVRADGQLDLEAARVLLRDGIGHLTRVSSETGLPPERTAAIVNDLQRILVEETRLGVPAIVHEEALAGVCANGATQFPQAIGMAATWNPDLVEEAAVAIRAELRAGGARQALAPVLDVTRDPRWGRLEETYGEDPYLAARMGVAYVRGLQGEDLATGVAATAKHFLAYGFPEGGMNHASAVIGARLLRDVVAAPFRAAINEAGLASVMAAYNDVDGLPCHGSAEILDALLRRELGFGGVVVADYFGIQLLASWHGLARADEDAAAVAIESGIDLELPTTQAYRNLPALVRAGRVGQGLVDRSCLRLLELKERLGLFTDPFAPEGGAAPFDRPGHRELARRVAEESIVVCTNDGVLPLRAGADLAVIGPSADDGRLFLGDYGYPAHVEIIHEVAQYEGPQVAGGRIMPALEQMPTATALDGLRSSGFRVRHVRGCDVQSADRSDIPAAVEAARRSEVAVVCVGGRSGLTG